MTGSDIDTLQIDLDRLGEWAVEKAMITNLGKQRCKLHESSGVGSSKLFFGRPKNTGSEQL